MCSYQSPVARLAAPQRPLARAAALQLAAYLVLAGPRLRRRADHPQEHVLGDGSVQPHDVCRPLDTLLTLAQAEFRGRRRHDDEREVGPFGLTRQRIPQLAPGDRREQRFLPDHGQAGADVDLPAQRGDVAAGAGGKAGQRQHPLELGGVLRGRREHQGPRVRLRCRCRRRWRHRLPGAPACPGGRRRRPGVHRHAPPGRTRPARAWRFREHGSAACARSDI